MSKQDSSTLKSYFETGDIPTQDSFASLIDSGLNLVDAGVNIATAGQFALQSQINKTITGTVTTANGSATVTGVGTKFLTEVTVNGPLIISGTSYTVTAVASDTSLTINPAFAAAPAPVASNLPALVDPGVSLLMSDASGHMSMQLSNGILNVPAGITTGQVTAAGFSGSGANLSGIPMSALTGAFTSAQLPDIPADKITGLLDVAHLNLAGVGITIDDSHQIAFGGTPQATVSAQSQINKTITGTVTTANGSATVTGVGTKFLTEVTVNGPLIIAGTSYTVSAVASDTSLTVNPPFAAAPAPVAINVPALVDPGVSLLMSDASGHMSMQLSNGILSVPAGIATGQVTAAGFSGSGANLSGIPMSSLTGSFTSAQLPDIPADKISGLLNSAQIPPIPASQITGQLAAAQVAGLVNLLFYAPVPCISNGALAQINWQTDPSYDLQLDYVDRGMAFSFSSKNGDIARGTGQFPAKIVQSTVFTLTSSVNNQVAAQRQVRVDVIPIPVQYAMQRQYEGYSTEQTIGILARRYSFVALTPNNVTALAGALNTASFPQGEIFKYIPAYYIALYGVGSFTQPYMTAMFNGVNQS